MQYSRFRARNACGWVVASVLLVSEGVLADDFPDLNVAALAYGRSPAYSRAECLEMGKKFDIVLEGIECRATIKSAYPDTVLLAYVNSSNCTRGDDLCNYLESRANPEDYFLNFVSDGIQQIDNKQFRRKKGQRVCAYGSWCDSNGDGTRWTTDYVSENSREAIAQFLVDRRNLPAHTDGWFVDNMDRACSYAGEVVAGSVDHGLEQVNKGSLSANLVMEKHCNELRKRIMDRVPAGLYVVDNISNWGITLCGGSYWWHACSNRDGKLSRKYAEGVLQTPGVLQEYYYRITNTYEDLATQYDGLKEIWDFNGKRTNSAYIMWYISAGTGDIPADSERVRLFALGTHLLFQFPAAYLRYDGQNRNNAPLMGDWFEAMGAPFGRPEGERIEVEAGRVYKRQFSNAIVIARYRRNSNDNYTDEGSYELGGEYFELKADGLLAKRPVSKVTLRNAEVFIGIRRSR